MSNFEYLLQARKGESTIPSTFKRTTQVSPMNSANNDKDKFNSQISQMIKSKINQKLGIDNYPGSAKFPPLKHL